MIEREYLDGKRHVHVLSYGGGTQSSALLLLALEGKVNGVIPDYIIFSNTGWEPRKVMEWVDKLNTYIKKKYNREILIASNGNIRENITEGAKDENRRFVSIPYFTKDPATGKQGMLWRACTEVYKIKAVDKRIRQELGYEPRKRIKEVVHLWKGISTDEIQRVKPSQQPWKVNEHPLVDILEMDRTECIQYVESLGLGTPPKSACIGCPYHNEAHWVEMKKEDPAAFEDACQVDEAMRKMPKLRNEMYMHRSLKPLREVVFNEQITIDEFNNECEGMCGL